MDYFESKKLMEFYITPEHDQDIYDMQVKIYDCRYCTNTHNRFEKENYFGLFISKYDLLFNSHGVGFLLNFKDPQRQFAKACNRYFSLEPNYIGLSSGGKCLQVKESFDEWVSSKIRRFLFGNESDFKFSELGYHIHSPDSKFSERKIKQMLNYFMKPSLKAMCDPTLSTKFSLPLFGGSVELDSVSREWLLLLTWYRKIATELEPALAAVKDAESKKKKKRNLVEKLYSTLLECQNLREILFKFDVDEDQPGNNSELEKLFTFKFQKLLNFNISDLQVLVMTDSKVILLRTILETSVKVASEAISYIFDLQGNLQIFQNNANSSQILVTISVRQFHNTLKKHFRKKLRFFNRFNENYLIELILQKVGNLLKIYIRDYPVCNDDPGLSRYRHNLEKMQRLVLDMIGDISFILIGTIDEFYNVKIKGLENMLRQISILLTSAAVLEQLHQSRFANKALLQAELNQKSELIREKIASIPAFLNITGDLQNTIHQMMNHCISLVDQRKEERSMMMLPAAIIYRDFNLYLSDYSNLFIVCPHPLLDLNELTSGKLYKFMVDSLIAFEKQKRSFGLVLQLAEHYVSEDIDE